VLLGTESRPEIVLALREVPTETYTAFERFLIAHELGHLILIRTGVDGPVGTAEYWKLEDLCDCFSRWLLMPERIVRAMLQDRPSTGTELLEISSRLALVAQVSWPTAAYRISDADPSLTFLRVGRVSDGRFKVSVSTLPKKREIGRRLAILDPLSEVLGGLRAHAGPAELDPQLLRSFPGLRGIVAAAAVRAGQNEVRLAIIRDWALATSEIAAEQAMLQGRPPIACPSD